MILGDVVVDRDIRRLVFLLLADDRTFIDQVLIADERRGFRLLGRRRAFHLHRSAVATALVAEAGSIGEFIVTALGTCFHACSLFSSVSLSASSPATACSTAEATSHPWLMVPVTTTSCRSNGTK